MEKITFDKLSAPLKVAIVFAWIGGILNTLGFIVGFLLAII